MTFLRRGGLALAGLCVFLSMLTAAAYRQVTDPFKMLQGFDRFADTSAKGVPADAYPDLAGAITDYLDGKRGDLSVIAIQGEPTEPFSERELQHMRDVRDLVRALGTSRFIFGALAIILMGITWLTSGRSEKRNQFLLWLLRGLAEGACLLLLLAGVLVVWGVIDFDGLFILFHRVMFSNQLWLLDPREHLLIMLMPTDFFIWYAQQILLAWLPILLLAVVTLAAAVRLSGKKRTTEKRE